MFQVHHLKKINTLRLEENSLEELPASFTRLRTLVSLGKTGEIYYTIERLN